MSRRTPLIVFAVLLALIGTGLIYTYADNADERAVAQQAPVQVLIAKQPIAQGTTGSAAEQAGAFELREIPASAVVPGALSDTSPIAAQTALAPIVIGEQIVASRFGTPGAQSSLNIPPGKVAISLQLGDIQRVAGFVQPGSVVAVFVTIAPQPGLTGQVTDAVRMLVPRAEVVAVGPTPVTPVPAGQPGANPEEIPRTLMTLAFNQIDAQKAILASQKGQLYFGLTTADSKLQTGVSVDLRNLFS